MKNARNGIICETSIFAFLLDSARDSFYIKKLIKTMLEVFRDQYREYKMSLQRSR